MKRSNNVFLVGPVGAGKSTIGKQLSSELKLQFYDSDREIESRCGVQIDWIFDIEGEEGFREREKNVLEDLANLQGIVLATGGGAIIYPENRTLLSSRGTVVYLQATIEQQLQRTSKDKKRPLLQVDDKEGQLRKLMGEREAMYLEIADYIIETTDTTVRNVVQKITTLLTDDSAIA
ncbi:MAG: shikimate kinase [Francisellaceae bacterium]|jgi:shikimate kinase